jgi:hypothetical protein
MYEKIVISFVGERRIRVHTLSVPVSDSLPEIFAAVDQEAIASIVGKIGK